MCKRIHIHKCDNYKVRKGCGYAWAHCACKKKNRVLEHTCPLCGEYVFDKQPKLRKSGRAG